MQWWTDLWIYCDVISSFNCHFYSNSVWPHSNYKLQELALSQTWGLFKKTVGKSQNQTNLILRIHVCKRRIKSRPGGGNRHETTWAIMKLLTKVKGKLEVGGARQMYRSHASGTEGIQLKILLPWTGNNYLNLTQWLFCLSYIDLARYLVTFCYCDLKSYLDLFFYEHWTLNL